MRAKEDPAARRMGDGASWGVVALPGASPYEGRAASDRGDSILRLEAVE